MNKYLKTLFFYNGIFVFASHLLGPLYALYVKDIDSSIMSVSISWSAFLFSTVIFTLLISSVGDKVKHKEYLLSAGYFVRAFVWFSYIFVGDITTLVLLQILLGVGESLGTPAYDALLAEHLDRGHHIADYANWKIISSLAGAISVFIGGYIVDSFGFKYLFVLMAFLALVGGFGVLTKIKRIEKYV